MRSVTDKIGRRYHCIQYFFPGSLAVCEAMWKNVVEAERSQMAL